MDTSRAINCTAVSYTYPQCSPLLSQRNVTETIVTVQQQLLMITNMFVNMQNNKINHLFSLK